MRLKDIVENLNSLYNSVDRLDDLLAPVYYGEYGGYDEEVVSEIASNTLCWTVALVGDCLKKCGMEAKMPATSSDDGVFLLEQGMALWGDDFSNTLAKLGVRFDEVFFDGDGVIKGSYAPEKAPYTQSNRLWKKRVEKINKKIDLDALAKNYTAEEIVDAHMTDLTYYNHSREEIEANKETLINNVRCIINTVPDVTVQDVLFVLGQIEDDSDEDNSEGESIIESTILTAASDERHKFLKEKLPGKYQYFLKRDIDEWKDNYDVCRNENKCYLVSDWKKSPRIVYLYNYRYNEENWYDLTYSNLKKIATSAAIHVLYSYYKKGETHEGNKSNAETDRL